MRWRGNRTWVYSYCMRCKTRQPLSKLVWQNGTLRCATNRCVSTALIGSRDLAVSRELQANVHELEPDPKLTTPVDRRNDLAEVLY